VGVAKKVEKGRQFFLGKK